MRWIASITFVLTILVPTAGHAQLLTGSVVDGDGPIAGALVEVRTVGEGVVSRTTTTVGGRFQVVLPPGMTVTIRALAIGYRPSASHQLTIAPGGRETIRIVLESAAFTLDPVVVTGSRGSCRGEVLDPATLGRIVEQLDQATAVLEAARVRRDVRFRTEWILREAIRGERDSLIWADTTAGLLTAWPAETAPEEELRERGFGRELRAAEGEGILLHGPDLAVLWSDWFLRTHCFSLEPTDTVGPEAPTLRVTFRPAERVRHIDIEGALEFDRESLALRRIMFRHVGLPSRYPAGSSGGVIELAVTAGGAWYPSAWRLWAPLELESAPRRIVISRPGAGDPRLQRTMTPRLGSLEVVGRAERIGRVVAVEEVRP